MNLSSVLWLRYVNGGSPLWRHAFGACAAVPRFLLAALFSLLLIDTVLTYVGITRLGAIEMNPLCAMLGLSGFIALKVAVTLGIPIFLLWFGRQNPRETTITCMFLNGVYSFVMLNNLRVMAVMI